jgi:endoglucanase
MRISRRLLAAGASATLAAAFLVVPEPPGAQAAASYNYAEALQKSIMFYEAQASGKKQPWNRAEWRGDATLNDGKDVGIDLSGGWYDAGDHVKFGFPMAFTTTMLAWGVVANREGYASSSQLTPMLNNLKWGTDYLIAAHPQPNVLYAQVGDGSVDHAYWGPPEVIDLKGMSRPAVKITASCPGTDLAGETAAAMAASALAFRATDTAYADQLVTHAKQLFTFADTTKGKDGQDTAYVHCVKGAQGYYTSTFEGGTNPGASKGYWDELAWAAIWLYKATGDATYLTRAREFYPKMGTEPDVGGGMDNQVPIYSFGLGWNDKAYAVYALMAQATSEQRFLDDAQRYLDYWTTGYKGKRGTYTPGGLAFIFHWGSLRMVADTAWVALVFADYLGKSNPRYATYHDFAKRQIDYALGDNPGKHSYVVGFGTKPPTHVHHRAASGQSLGYMNDLTGPNRHTIYGALAGGPDASDGWTDDRNDYQRNEVAIDFNAGFTAALGRLAKEYGGTPVPDSQLVDPKRDAEMTVEPTVYNTGSYGATIAIAITNKSGWPPRVMKKAKARYYFTLDGSTTISQIKVRAQGGGAGCKVTGPTLYSGSTYYAEIDCTGVAIYPGDNVAYQRTTGLQIDAVSPGVWDPANDWSAKSAQNITLYDDNGTLVFGKPPAA